MGKKDRKKDAGPKFARPAPNAEPQEEKPKQEFTQLRPPGADAQPPPGTDESTLHQMEAAAARAEDRAKQEADKPEPEATGSEDPDTFDENALRMAAQSFLSDFKLREVLQTDEQKKLIEARLEDTPIELKQIYEMGEFRQIVPIVVDSFEPEFRSLTPEEDIELKAMMSKEDQEMSLRYLQDKYGLYSLICGLNRLNESTFPAHFTNQGGWDKDKFLKKATIIMRMPVQAIWSLMVHYGWFDERCREVFKVSDLKNG